MAHMALAARRGYWSSGISAAHLCLTPEMVLIVGLDGNAAVTLRSAVAICSSIEGALSSTG